MRLGISLAQSGRLARPAVLTAAARAAEQLGYSSVWVCDSVLDPTGVLAAVAAVTTRVRLGAYVSVASVADPASLARSLATVDVLAEGRLSVVLTGEDGPVDAVLDAVDDRCGHATGARPPVYLDGDSPAALERVARRAAGWGPTAVPVEHVARLWPTVRHLATAYGRVPGDLQLVVRAGIVLDGRAAEPVTRPAWHGDADQVAADVDAVRRIGADEVVLRLDGDVGLDDVLDGYARIAEAAELRALQIR
jgi:alkanesulfonate monooxygenase SsuD/methylene tetrahydromethanopterin reductase-like flavin-dependent oxidoreductase (luciferase family)